MTCSTSHLNPSLRTLRQFGFLCVGFFGCTAFAQAAAGLWAWAGIWAAISIGAGLAALFKPDLLRKVFVASLIVTYPLGWAMSHVLISLFFYGLVTPLGLMLRIVRHDPLGRQFKPKCKTYWEPKAQKDSKISYLRTY